MSEAMVEARKLTKLFKTRKGRLRAVDDLSFTCYGGEIFGLLGPNGAGKTTALRMLATILTPSSGTVMVAGFDTKASPDKVREQIGFLATETSAKSVLDKLVQVPTPAPQPPQPVRAEPVPPAESTPDDELLRKLTHGAPNAEDRVWEPTQTPASVETEPSLPSDSSASGRSDLPDAQPPEANTNILDELTNRPGSKPEQTDKSGEGDMQNA